MLNKHIFDIFMEHDTLLHPEVVNYFQDQEDPEGYVNNLVKNLTDFPMVLTMEEVHNHENVKGETRGGQIKAPKPSEPHKLITQEKNSESVVADPIPEIKINGTVTGGQMKTIDGTVGAVPDISTKTVPDLSPKTRSHPVIHTTLKKTAPPPDFKIISDITGKSTCEGLIKDFTRNINHRYKTLKNIIRTQYRVFNRSVDIEKIKLNYKRETYFIGMITSVNTTKKGNTIITVEDESGEVNVFLNSEHFKFERKFLLDEVVGVIGETNVELKMVMAERVVRPSTPRTRRYNRAEEDIEVLFISDIHVGSREFLERYWNNFIKWLNGKSELPGKINSDKIGYMVVAGDLVDGIGIYPDQQDELVIKDIYKQYSRLAELLEPVPENIKIIMVPGNHDAVRQAEPQPALSTEFQKDFSKNTVFVGNPCYMALHGVEILIYHGRSFDDIVKYIPEASYKNPVTPMKEMLLRRHLVPIYGERTPIAPEHHDMLLLDRLPDIFVTGHVHTAGHEYFSDMLLINASAWQAQTSFQKTLNFNPDPCKAYLVNLNTIRTTELDFTARNF